MEKIIALRIEKARREWIVKNLLVCDNGHRQIAQHFGSDYRAKHVMKHFNKLNQSTWMYYLSHHQEDE